LQHNQIKTLTNLKSFAVYAHVFLSLDTTQQMHNGGILQTAT